MLGHVVGIVAVVSLDIGAISEPPVRSLIADVVFDSAVQTAVNDVAIGAGLVDVEIVTGLLVGIVEVDSLEVVAMVTTAPEPLHPARSAAT